MAKDHLSSFRMSNVVSVKAVTHKKKCQKRHKINKEKYVCSESIDLLTALDEMDDS